jgi:propanol-preferring alcohol dehydrogenase
MRAAVVREFKRPLVIEERPVPEPGEGQVLVKIEASGLCHTDMHTANGDWPVKPSPPFVPGHEGVGIVQRAGRGVTRVREGDRVAIPWLGWACRGASTCLTGWETLCERQQNSGYSVDGGWAEYALASGSYVGKVPNGMNPFEAAP